MHFVATIHLQDACIARMSCTPRDGESHEETAARAYESLVRDAARHSSDDILTPRIEEIARIHRDMVAAQLATRQARTLTVISKADGETRAIEGQVALLTGSGDLVALLTAYDAKWIAEKDAFLDSIGLGGRKA